VLYLCLVRWRILMRYDKIAYILLRMAIGLAALLLMFQPG